MSGVDLEALSEEEARDLLRRIVEALELAEEDGIFGKDSWQGFLEIEVD